MSREETGDPSVFHEVEAQRYVFLDDGRVIGIAEYAPSGGAHVFSHTEVLPAHEGGGVGSRLVRAALDDARRRGWTIVARCSFVAAFIRRHPDYADLLVAGDGRPAT